VNANNVPNTEKNVQFVKAMLFFKMEDAFEAHWKLPMQNSMMITLVSNYTIQMED